MTESGIGAAKVRNGIEEFLKGKYFKFRGATPARRNAGFRPKPDLHYLASG